MFEKNHLVVLWIENHTTRGILGHNKAEAQKVPLLSLLGVPCTLYCKICRLLSDSQKEPCVVCVYYLYCLKAWAITRIMIMTSIHSLVKVNVAVAQVCCANFCCGKILHQTIFKMQVGFVNINKGDTSISLTKLTLQQFLKQ